MHILKQLARLASAFALVGSAHADLSLLDSSMYRTIIDGGNNATIDGVTFNSTPGSFASYIYFTRGLGVDGGATGDQIDIGETVSLSWASGLVITRFSVSALYNGPEFGDWVEIAQVSAYSGATLVGTGQLQVDAVTDDLATFSGTGFGSVVTLSPADAGHFGAWTVNDPFGGALVTRLEFTAVQSSLCASASCSNQSDYALLSVAAIPEPQTYALMLAGLAAVVYAGRRRRSSIKTASAPESAGDLRRGGGSGARHDAHRQLGAGAVGSLSRP
jgi:hypothetical protein